MASVSKLSTLSLSAMILASAGSSAFALDFNDKFYGKAQAGIRYSAGFYSGDVKNAIDEAKTAGEKTNKTSHSITANVGFNVFYKLNDKIHPFAGLNVEGKYAFNNEFVKDNNFQNFLNVNAKLGSSFKVSKDLNIRPYALVGMSVNQYKTKERVDAVENANVNMLYGTAEQNANGKYDAALAYAQYNNMFSMSDFYDPATVKVYASNSAFKNSEFNTNTVDDGSEVYSYIKNLNTGTNIDNFTSALKNAGINYYDVSEQLFGDDMATSNILRVTGNNGETLGYAFFDYSNAVGLSGNLAGVDETGTFEQRLSSYETNEGIWQDWMTRWLELQLENEAPSNIPGRAGTTNMNNNETHYNVGLNVGAGVEFVIKDRFTVGVEYRYTDVKVSGTKFQLHNIGAKFGVEFL